MPARRCQAITNGELCLTASKSPEVTYEHKMCEYCTRNFLRISGDRKTIYCKPCQDKVFDETMQRLMNGKGANARVGQNFSW